ncbi:MAG: isoprenylcysteine carboxylmethyltransferase family protein [Caulobacteraceae bacterium]
MIIKLVLQTFVWAGLMVPLLFWPAGTLAWPGGWALIALLAGPGLLIGLWLARRDPGLLNERLGGPLQEGQKAWDRIFLALLMIGFHAWFVVMALDAKRYAWSAVPVWAQVLGGALILIGYGGVMWVYAANSFAAPVVRMQEERTQTVVDTGPYALVRHPMYAAAVLMFIGMPLTAGSLWGLVGTALIVPLLAVRIRGEEAMLRAELAGYEAYAAKVRFRLLPGVW